MPAVHLHGPRRAALDIGLPDDDPAPAGRSQPAVRGLRRASLGPGAAMTQTQPLGPVLHSFFASHLITVKGLRPASVRSYRDTVRLFLVFTAAGKGCKITRLALTDLTFDQVVAFLRHLDQDRGNHARTRNQRLAALHCLFDYIAGRAPEMLATCQQVAAIPVKRTAPPETRFLERDEVEDLLRHLPRDSPLALRDQALILFLYNTGARAQEVADLRVDHLDLGEHPLARLHGKGGKWRTCPLDRKSTRLNSSHVEISYAVFCLKKKKKKKINTLPEKQTIPPSQKAYQ